MILVIGGLASGKREYIRSLGFAESEIADAVLDMRPALVNAQELVHDNLANPAEIADALAAKQIVACRDVGGGIVPIDAGERRWRERAGALSCELAIRAKAVIRMSCGIPQALKGSDPRLGSLELVLMRHGSTAPSERRAYTGWLDAPLTQQGEAEARAAGEYPEYELVHASTLDRARHTARICFPRARIVAHDGLREMHFGAFEGLTADEMADDTAYRAWVEGGCEGRCPGGEGKDGFIARTTSAIRGIVLDSLAAGKARAIIVAHGGTVMAAMSSCARTRRDYHAWSVGPCQGYRANARFMRGQLVFEDERHFETLDFLRGSSEADIYSRASSSSFFQNRDCPYFPCHEGITAHDFNCLFCYCPLYALGRTCGGNFTYTASGRKNCSACTLPHEGESGVKLVADHYDQLAELAR